MRESPPTDSLIFDNAYLYTSDALFIYCIFIFSQVEPDMLLQQQFQEGDEDSLSQPASRGYYDESGGDDSMR